MILIILRRFNDIDHSTPIVYKFVEQGYKDIVMLALDPSINISNDFRLKFLREKYNVKIDYVYKYYTPRVIHKFASYLVCDLKVFSSFIISRILSIFNFSNYFYNNLFGFEWSINMIENKRIKMLVFDWQRPGKFNTKSLIKAGKEKKIPLIAVPHGVGFAVNPVWSNTALKKGLTKMDFSERWKDFDQILVQHEQFKNMVIDSGVPEKKLTVLGSTRFCKEWENIYFNIIPETDKYYNTKDQDKINIVYMDHSHVFRLNVDEIVSTIENLAKLDYVNLVIKPSTGSKESMASKKLYELAKVDHDTSSVTLINWSDIVIGNETSILLDVLIMNKILICPEYFGENQSLFRTRNISLSVSNYSDLLKAIEKVRQTPDYVPYKIEDVNLFITDIVYGGVKNRDVLNDYRQFLLSRVID